MKNLIYESWKSWRVCFMAGFDNFFWGLSKMLECIILGILSLIVHLWRFTCRLVGSYPNVALGSFLVVSFIVWLLTFANMRHRAVSAEDQRDSVSWQFKNFKQQHGYE